MKDEIYQIINEVVNTSSLLGPMLSPEWCTVFRLEVELRYLQSNYEQLYNQHMSGSHEITPDLSAKMLNSYSLLRKSYLELIKTHAALKDDLERLARQLTRPVEVCDAAAGCLI